jgi:hypothetical protein
MASHSITKLEQLAQLIRDKNMVEDAIADIIGRPALMGHVGEYIAASIFGIELEQSAARESIDGHFVRGPLAEKTVNIKWYGKMEGLLDITLDHLPDFYLVMTGPKSGAISSRGTKRPWLISSVFLFDAHELVRVLKLRGVKIGVATSVRARMWEEAQIHPVQRNNKLLLSSDQKKQLALFG